MVYHLLRGAARAALRLYYADIRVQGREYIPRDRPVLLLANHPNALVDAMLVATIVEQHVCITARATLFESPLLSALLRRVGVIPLLRAQDVPSSVPAPGRLTRNLDARAQVVEALRGRAAVLVFPEGVSHDRAGLAPLRSGAARIALQAYDATVHNLQVLPIGIAYVAKDQPHSDVVVRFGPPLDVDMWRRTSPDEGPAAMTREFARRLDALFVDSASWPSTPHPAALAASLAASRVFAALMDETSGKNPAVRSADDIVATAHALASASPDLLRRAERFVDDANTLTRQLLARGRLFYERDSQLALSVSSPPRDVLLVLALFPVAVLGGTASALLLRVSRLIALRSLRHDESRDQPAMRTMLIALVSLPIWCAALVAALAPRFGPLTALLLLGVTCAAAMIHTSTRAHFMNAARRLRTRFLPGASTLQAAALHSAIRTLRDEACALMVELRVQAPSSR